MRNLVLALLLVAVIGLSGCGMARVDYWSGDVYISATVFTLFKEVELGPYQSKNSELYMPWFLTPFIGGGL